MSLPPSCDIAIVGGGLVGATLALNLARQGLDWSIVVLDAQPTAALPSPSASHFDARSTALSKGSQRLLASWGVWASLASEAAPIRHIQVSDQQRWAGAQMSADACDLDALGYVVENAVLGRTLQQALASEEQVTWCASTDVVKATACLRDDESALPGYRLAWRRSDTQSEGALHARLLIVADGAQSPLRHQLGVGADRHDYGQMAWVANVRVMKPHQGHAFERFTPQGPLALLPLGDGDADDGGRRMALVWTQTLSTSPEDRGEWSDQTWCDALRQALGQRLGGIERVGKRSGFPLERVVAKESVRSQLVFMGNAAHFLHPVAGQGFNLALRDGERLTQVLKEAWQTAPDSFGHLTQLQAYAAAQRHDQQATIVGSHQLVQWFGRQSGVAKALRSIGLWELEQMPWLKQAFLMQTLGLGVHQVSTAGE